MTRAPQATVGVGFVRKQFAAHMDLLKSEAKLDVEKLHQIAEISQSRGQQTQSPALVA